MNDLKCKSVKATGQHIEWVLSRSGSFSRYIRTLIDREMGAEEARTLVAAKQGRYDDCNTQQKNQLKPLVWKL